MNRKLRGKRNRKLSRDFENVNRWCATFDLPPFIRERFHYVPSPCVVMFHFEADDMEAALKEAEDRFQAMLGTEQRRQFKFTRLEKE